MSQYAATSVKKAISKAVRNTAQHGTMAGTKERAGAIRACKTITADIDRINQLMRAHESHAQTLDRNLRSLHGEQRRLLVHLLVDVAIIAIPVAKVLRVRRIISSLLATLRAGRQANFAANVQTAIDLIINIVGIYDALANLNRLRELPSEISNISNRAEQLSGELQRIQNELQRAQRAYEQNRCGELEGPLLSA